MGGSFNNRLANLQTRIAIPQAVAQPHAASPIGQHNFSPVAGVPGGPQGQHFYTPQGDVYFQQRQQAIAAAQAQEAARIRNLATALREQIEQEELAAQQSNNNIGYFQG